MTPPTTSAPLGKMLAVFIGMLIFGNLLLAGVQYFLPDLTAPSSIGMVFVALGSIQAGQVAARHTGRLLTMGEKVSFALAATALSIVMSVAFLWGIFAWFGVPFTVENVVLIMTGDGIPYGEIMKLLPWIGLFGVAISLILSFFSVGWGARSMLKQQERLAAKGK